VIRALRRLLRRAGIIPYRSLVCSCGYRVPFTGNRHDQVHRALAHFDSFHDRPNS